MGEQERPGEREGIRIKAGEGTDKPPSDEAEGHAMRGRPAAPQGEETEAPPSDEAEGHGWRGKYGTPEGGEPPTKGESEGDTEGHSSGLRDGRTWPQASDADEDESEGHAYRWNR